MDEQRCQHCDDFWQIEFMSRLQVWMVGRWLDYLDLRRSIKNTLAEWRRRHIQWVHEPTRGKVMLVRFTDRFILRLRTTRRGTD